MNYLGNHSEHDTDNLWLLFESAINFSSHKTEVSKEKFISAFNNVKNQKSFSIDITMFLSWIRPNDFINLNSSVYQFLSDNGFTPKFFKSKSAGNTPDGDTYIRLMEKCRKRFPEISSFAELYDFSQQSLSDRKETEGSSENNHCGNEDNGSTRYWLYAPGGGASKWEKFYGSGVMAVGWGEIGELKRFGSKDEIKEKMKEYYVPSLSHKNDALAAWQFSMEMKPGDIVFVKKGKHSIVGRGVVTSDYRYDSSVSDSYKNIRTVNWTDNGEWEHPGQAVMKTLTDITKETDYVNKLNALFPAPQPENPVPERYTSEDFLNEVFISEEKYRLLVCALNRKKNIVLQGPPGVGKTYSAKRLAYSMMGAADNERIKLVQFHQSYSYEDFIMGYRPTQKGGFELYKGVFYSFCKKAEHDKNRKYFFIIDEINRGNLSKIFGELFMLLEADKRGMELSLLYSGENFAIPENIYIIGTMNTADRSLALPDYALRRRFSFFNFEPACSSESFRAFASGKHSTKLCRLISCVKELNEEIVGDGVLGSGFKIGHSYFCTDEEITDELLKSIVECELIPILSEYWFDEPHKFHKWSKTLRSAIL